MPIVDPSPHCSPFFEGQGAREKRMQRQMNPAALQRAVIRADAAERAMQLAHYQQQAEAAERRVAVYRAALRAHDWTFESSDDGQAYRRGRDERAALEAERRAIDKSGSIWNSLCPAAYRVAP